MTLRRLGFVGAALVGALTVQGVAATPALAWEPGGGGSGISWQYSEEGSAYYRKPQGGESSPGRGGIPTVFVSIGQRGETLRCEEAAPAPDADCDGEISRWCSDTDRETGKPRFPAYRFTREIRPNGEPEPWTVDESADFEWCIVPGDDDWVPIEEITTEINYEVFQPLGDPKIHINPGEEAIVNLPTVVSTDYPGGNFPGPGEIVSMDPLVVRIPVDIERPGDNLTGEILAEGEFTWTFEGGGTATGRGKPYTPEIDPRNDGGYYVSTVFREPGRRTINLDVRFTGEVTVEGLDPEPIEPVEDIGTSAQVNVVELNNVLN